MKIVSTGKTLASSEFHQKKVKAKRKRLVTVSSTLFVLFIGLILMSRLSALRISAVEVTGATVTGKEPVGAKVEEVLAGYYLWVVPVNSAFLYPGERLEKTLLEAFPRFSSVEASLNGFSTLSIDVSEREPAALYCAEEKCYFLDESGFIFDRAPVFSDGVYFTYTKAEGIPEPLGEQFLPREDFKSLAGFVEKFKKFGLTPQKLSVNMDVRTLTLSTGAIVYWLMKSDLEKLSLNLDSFLNSPEIKGQQDFWDRVAQVDLRAENKVFYTFRE